MPTKAPSPALSSRASTALTDLLIGVLEYSDPFFRGGTSLSRLLSLAIGRELQLDEEELQAVELAALLRDLSRMALRAHLVPGRDIDAGEARRRIEGHVDLTLQLLEGFDLPDGARQAIRHHHENFDGSGYPDGLRGETIPLASRILTVADSFAAILAPRPYRLPRRIPGAVQEIQKGSGRQYDPQVVDALIRSLAKKGPHEFSFGLRHHVLVVHPEETVAHVLAIRLCSHGYLAEALSGADSVRERLRRTPVDALVLAPDYHESDIGAFVREVRSADAPVTLPIIMIGVKTVEQRVTLLEAGADVCFPVDMGFGELRAMLGTLMGQAARHRVEAHSDNASPAPWHALQGGIREFPLTWLLQMLKYDLRTAAIVLTKGTTGGIVYVDRGDPYHAETEDMIGESALGALLNWDEGSFVVQPDVRRAARTIDRPLMELLLENAVDQDHSRAIFGTVTTQ